MDLNHQYFEHQLALMRAATSPSRLSRTKHLAAAGVIAHRIGRFQLTQAATASEGWLSRSAQPA